MKHTDCQHPSTSAARAACRTRGTGTNASRQCVCAAQYLASSWHEDTCPRHVPYVSDATQPTNYNLSTLIHPEVQARWVNMTTDSGLVMCAINGRDVLHAARVNGPEETLSPLCGGSRRQSTYTPRDRADGLVAQDKLCAGCNRHLTRLEINEQVSARHAIRTLEQSMIAIAVGQRPSLP